MKKLPRLRFAHLPTPIESLPRLSEELGGPRLFVKRDDLTGLAFGGNKTRKLEYLLADAQSHGAKTLISTGAVQSNHCRQTAAAAARIGFECVLVLVGAKPDEIDGNLLLDQMLGAKFIWTDKENRDRVLDEVFQEYWERGKRPYLIPYGGSNPVGAGSYAIAYQEMVSQIKRGQNEGLLMPDWIVFPSSSGGTQAGLVVGARYHGESQRVLGISVDEPQNELRVRVANLAGETAEYLGVKQEFNADHILVNSDYLGGGYGILGEVELEAIRLFARTEGLLLDPVYTGRAAAGLIDLIRAKYFGKGDIVMFWHTGGTPALFAPDYRQRIAQYI